MEAVNVARWVALVAAFVMGAVAEWKLGVAVGLDVYTAALLPLTLDVYGFAAFKTGYRLHVTCAVTVMFAAQAVSHLLTLGAAPWHMVALSIAVSGIAPGVSLACHRIGDRVAEVDAVDAPETVPASCVTTTAREGVRPSTVVVDELHERAEAEVPAETVDVQAETVDVPVVREVPSPVSGRVDVVDVPADDAEALRSKAEIAAEGLRLKNELGSWTAAADAMGISRQWLAQCRKASGIGVSVPA